MKRSITRLLLRAAMIVGAIPLSMSATFAGTTNEHTVKFEQYEGYYEEKTVYDGDFLPAEVIPTAPLLENKLNLGWIYTEDGKTCFFNESLPITKDLTLTYLRLTIDEVLDYNDKKEITTSDKESLTSLSGIYTVSTENDIVIDNRVSVYGKALIILPDGCNITFSHGIEVPEYRELFIVASDQISGTGKLISTGGDYQAGIGGGRCTNGGIINIYGGIINATGGINAAGIGGGGDIGVGGAGGKTYIYGGNVTANGNKNAAGIGGGRYSKGGNTSIYGGTIVANGGSNAAGIGGGSYANGDVVYISGGNVTANGGTDAAGIGGGTYGEFDAIYIYGGVVKAVASGRGNGIGNGYNGTNDGSISITGGIVRAEGKIALSGNISVTNNMSAYNITNGENGAPCTISYSSFSKILISPLVYDYLEVENGAYIDTCYKPTNNTRVVMNVYVNGGREYWFGAWDINFNSQVFALGNDKTEQYSEIYAGYGNQGGGIGNGTLVPTGYHAVELDKNIVKIDDTTVNTFDAETFKLENTLFLFAQNRKGTATTYNDQSKIHCYGCEIYEGSTLMHRLVPGKNRYNESGLWDFVTGIFYDNSYENKGVNKKMTARFTGDVEVIVNPVSVTCTEDGQTGCYKKSGKYYQDEECTIEIADLSVWLLNTVSDGGSIIPALGHDWVASLENHTCNNCGSTEPHFDLNNDKCCDECGYELLIARDITYLTKVIDQSTSEITTETARFTGDAYTIVKSDKVWGESNKTTWFVLDENVTLDNRPQVRGDVRIILKNGKTLSANYGITVESGNSLSIYSQSEDKNEMGTLNIAAPSGENAIGGRKGGNASLQSPAGEPGGHYWTNGGNGGSCGNISIFGGNLILKTTNAVCIGGGNGGAGAGDTALEHEGTKGGNGGNGGNINFYAGCYEFNATNASAIGGGIKGKGGNPSNPLVGGDGIDGANATLTIYGKPEIKVGANSQSASESAAYNGENYLNVEYSAIHEHNFSYQLDGDTLTAKCSGCNEETSIKLIVPEMSIYDGSQKTASLEGKDNFVVITSAQIGSILYSNDGGLTYTANAPVNAGTYKVKTTICNKELSAQFTIAKSTPNKDDFTFTSPENCEYDGLSKQANIMSEKEGMGVITLKYLKQNNNSWEEIESDYPIEIGKYKVAISVAEGTNFESSLTDITRDNWIFEITPPPCEHEYVDGECIHCHEAQPLQDAQSSTIKAIHAVSKESEDVIVTLLADKAEALIHDARSVAEVLEIRDYWLTAINKQLTGIIHEHTFSETWSSNSYYHWHNSTCEHDVVSNFAEHTFDNGVINDNVTTYTCSKCGYTKRIYNTDGDSEGEIVNEISYTGISLTLTSDIAINFYMNITNEAIQNGKMTFDIGGRIVKINGTDIKYDTIEKKYYFSTPLTALEMNETITATFSYNGFDYVQEYSVIEYINKIIENSDLYGEKIVTLAMKIANYGHYIQTYLDSIHTKVVIGENGYAPIDKFDTVDINVDAGKEALDDYIIKVTGQSENISLYGCTVYFDSATALNYYITVSDGIKPTATAVNKINNKEMDVEIELYKDNIYIVSVKDIFATELADDIEVKINDELTFTGSVFAYCNSVIKAHTFDGATDIDNYAVEAMVAFYEYYLAAKNLLA